MVDITKVTGTLVWKIVKDIYSRIRHEIGGESRETDCPMRFQERYKGYETGKIHSPDGKVTELDYNYYNKVTRLKNNEKEIKLKYNSL